MFEITLNPGEDAAVLHWLRQVRDQYADAPINRLRAALRYAENAADDIVRNASALDDLYISCGMCGAEFNQHFSPKHWYLDTGGKERDLCQTCAHRLEDGIRSGDLLYDTLDEQLQLLDDPETSRLNRRAARQLRCRYARLLEWELDRPIPEPD